MNVRGGFAAVLVALAVAGCGNSTKGVSPSAYVKSFCTAYRGFKQDVQTASTQAQGSIAGSKSVVVVKRGLQPFAAALVAAFDRFAARVKAAGTPDVSGGKAVVNQYSSAFQGFHNAFAQVQTQFAQLPTNNVRSFNAAAQAAQAQFQQNVSQVKSSLSLKKNSTLHAAALKDPTCVATSAVT